MSNATPKHGASKIAIYSRRGSKLTPAQIRRVDKTDGKTGAKEITP